jgi:hypothetical protein
MRVIAGLAENTVTVVHGSWSLQTGDWSSRWPCHRTISEWSYCLDLGTRETRAYDPHSALHCGFDPLQSNVIPVRQAKLIHCRVQSWVTVC